MRPDAIDKNDPRYLTLKKGFNLRWPSDAGAEAIYICRTPEEVIESANDAIKKGKRITVRSGGHCYEGFVSNKEVPGIEKKELAIIDLSLMNGLDYSKEQTIKSEYDNSTNKKTYKFKALTGNQNWDGANSLYKISNCTIPGGSCYSVGSGGHICGGGYGLLSRKYGLTVDWLSGVDILIPYVRDGKTALKAVHANKTNNQDLFKACRGAGGGNFGIILAYYYETLPYAPKSVYLLTLTYKWEDMKTEADFKKFLDAYWKWFEDNDKDWNSPEASKNNGGLFTLLKLHYKSSGAGIQLLIQYTGQDGTVSAKNHHPFIDFVNSMNIATGHQMAYSETISYIHGPSSPLTGDEITLGDVSAGAADKLPPGTREMDWLYATQTLNGSGDNQYGKYKSVYQKQGFTDKAIKALWNNLNYNGGDVKLKQALVQIDSYGGCINARNRASNELISGDTSVYQRSSLLKWQFQVYWTDEINATDCQKWIQGIYADCFDGGKPYRDINPAFDGCYINYPDVDMKYTSDKKIDPLWLELYYGDIAGELIDIKNKYDKSNIFFHEMSIPLLKPTK